MTHPNPTNIQMLAARWRIFAKALAAAARAVLQPQRGRAAVSADEVEVWVFASIMILNRQIAFLSEVQDSDPETEAALNDLKALAIILLRLAMIIACFKARISRAPWYTDERPHACAPACLPAWTIPAYKQAALSHAANGYVDSS